nr:F-box domain, leucine-rich repeat domain, L domain-like protein [Tanacetum cinerariifolium]
MPLGDHAAHWSSYIEEAQFDLRPHMESPDWTEINAGIHKHLQKAYNINKAAFKAQHWEEMWRLEAMGTYTDDEINRLVRGGKQRGNIAGVGRVLPARATASPSMPAHDSTLNNLYKKVDFMMSIFKSDSKYLNMFSQFESGGASRSGGWGDEEEGGDHQDDEDEDGDGDT